jgi:hypothetical protein
MPGQIPGAPGAGGAIVPDSLILQLQSAIAEGSGGFIPLKMGAMIGAFRPGAGRSAANTTVVLRDRMIVVTCVTYS